MNPSLAPCPPASHADYSRVTERPGQKASALQLQMLRARYGWAAGECAGCDVLEAACGAGMGLETLARVARSVTAGDLDAGNLAAARRVYAGDARITLRPLDASRTPYPDASFDRVLLFEALYYLADAGAFLAEARRLLRPAGRLLVASVNPQWRGFHPSPFSVAYHSGRELEDILRAAGFAPAVQAGFPETGGGRAAMTGLIRSAAVRCGLIPRTMAGKAWLKRLFYGELEDVPERIQAAGEQPAGLLPLAACRDLSRYRVLYAAGHLD